MSTQDLQHADARPTDVEVKHGVDRQSKFLKGIAIRFLLAPLPLSLLLILPELPFFLDYR